MTVHSRSNWTLEVLVSEERGQADKQSTQTKTSQSKGENQQQTVSTGIWHQCQDLNPGPTGGRGVPSTLHYPYLP